MSVALSCKGQLMSQLCSYLVIIAQARAWHTPYNSWYYGMGFVRRRQQTHKTRKMREDRNIPTVVQVLVKTASTSEASGRIMSAVDNCFKSEAGTMSFDWDKYAWYIVSWFPVFIKSASRTSVSMDLENSVILWRCSRVSFRGPAFMDPQSSRSINESPAGTVCCFGEPLQSAVKRVGFFAA